MQGGVSRNEERRNVMDVGLGSARKYVFTLCDIDGYFVPAYPLKSLLTCRYCNFGAITSVWIESEVFIPNIELFNVYFWL
jgi:hypothetical protein